MFKLFRNQNSKILFASSCLFITMILPGCTGNKINTLATEQEAVAVDPFEDINRQVHGFNGVVDDYIAKPISDAYLWITPQFFQTGVANVFNNLEDINVVLNDLMQGKGIQGLEDTGRFAVNSTAGLLGLIDVASSLGLEKHNEDFAQTLAVWGVPQGPYLVLPFLGPVTARGIPGSIFDTAANPASYVGAPVQLVQMLNARANAEGGLNFINEAALDPYVFTRESFLQYRHYLISDGQSEADDSLLDLDDDWSAEEDDINPVTSVKTNSQSYTKGYTLELSSDLENFNQASKAFDDATKSFNAASHSFEQAADKLNKIP